MNPSISHAPVFLELTSVGVYRHVKADYPFPTDTEAK